MPYSRHACRPRTTSCTKRRDIVSLIGGTGVATWGKGKGNGKSKGEVEGKSKGNGDGYD